MGWYGSVGQCMDGVTVGLTENTRRLCSLNTDGWCLDISVKRAEKMGEMDGGKEVDRATRGGERTDRQDSSDPNQIMGSRKHSGMPYGQIFVNDEEYCRWSMRQVRPMVGGLKDFKNFVMRTEDARRNMERKARSEGSEGLEQRQKLELSERFVDLKRN